MTLNRYLLRVVLDTEEDVIRDILVSGNFLLTELHSTILKAFELEAGEMASFYMSNDEWEQGEEISLMSFGPGSDQQKDMEEVQIEEALSREGSKMIYVYDFLNLWTFFIEVLKKEESPEEVSPSFIKITGERPKEAPHKNMEGEDLFDDESFSEDDDLGYWDEDAVL